VKRADFHRNPGTEYEEVEHMNWTAVFMEVPEGYIGFVEELPGANTQGATLEEARENLKEAVSLVLEANRELAQQAIAGQKVTREVLVLAA
jgi:predicted RNase H-like HicB family nuclease